MSATALPLPLALRQPVPLAADLNTLLAAGLDAGSTTYDPETQMRPQVVSAGSSHTSTRCVNRGLLQVDDVIADITL